MTKEQRREIYWVMYVTAIGLAQMGVDAVRKEWIENGAESERFLPAGMCWLGSRIGGVNIYDMAEMKELRPDFHSSYWFEMWDWKPRAALLLKAIELTYKN